MRDSGKEGEKKTLYVLHRLYQLGKIAVIPPLEMSPPPVSYNAPPCDNS